MGNRSDMKSIIKKCFQDIFGEPLQLLVSAPGRVNLIGGHTDYNEGFVFPLAIYRRIYVASSPRADKDIHAYSLNYQKKVAFPVTELIVDSRNRWVNYVKGVLAAFSKSGCETGTGANLVIGGDVPLESGLSSSAALEMSVAFSFNHMFEFGIEIDKLVTIAREAENDFVGVPCGIMDQFTSGLAKKDCAIFLDCRSLEYEHIPINSSSNTIVICNTNKPRGVADSAYHERWAECESGVKILKGFLPGIQSLRDVTITEFMAHREHLPHPVSSRCEHIIAENQRVLDSVKALKAGDADHFGKLINEAHESISRLYEVSCLELDTLVNIARSVSGVLGARLTGAGFGGCTVNMKKKEAVPILEQKIMNVYPRETGLQPEIYVSQAVDGVKIES